MHDAQAQCVAGAPEDGRPVQLDTTLYLPDSSAPAPAVLLAHGFGGTKDDRWPPRLCDLAQHGYVVLAYTARGFWRAPVG